MRWKSCRGWSGITTSRLPTLRPCRPGMSRNYPAARHRGPDAATAATSFLPDIRDIRPSGWPGASIACRAGCGGCCRRIFGGVCRPARDKNPAPPMEAFCRSAWRAARTAVHELDFDIQCKPANGPLQRRLSRRTARRWTRPVSRRTAGRQPQPRPGRRREPGRPGDLPPLRPDDQGGYRVDGPRAGVPGAVSRLSPGRVGGENAAKTEVPLWKGQTHPAGSVCRSAPAGDPTTVEDGVRRPSGPLVPQRTEGLCQGRAAGPRKRSAAAISAPRPSPA